jgi:hypothetical protein
MEWENEHERRDEDLLPSHEYDHEKSQDSEVEGRNSIKVTLFVIPGTTATLTGRKILRSGFRELFATYLEHVN